MNRFGFSILSTLVTLALMPIGAVAQQKSLKDQLVGTWMLVSNDVMPPNGPKRQDFGANPKGILIFDAGGRYVAVTTKLGRPKFKDTGNVRLETPAAEYGEAARNFAANFGSWSVNEADKTLARRLDVALIPNAEGTEQKASVSLAADELKLITTSPTGVRTEAVYRRAK
jgi:Lipocalin-like domain